MPFRPDGKPDFEALARQIARTAAAGLTPAVNMDTGYVQLLDADTRDACPADRAAECGRAGLRRRRLRRRRARRRVRPRRATATRCDAIARPGRHAGDLPVARAQRARPTTDGSARTTRSAPRRPVHRLRARPDVRAVRPDLLARRVRRAARRSRSVHRRQALVAAAGSSSGTASRCATACVPTSTCSPATTSPSTWSCTARDYLLGLSTFAPEAFAARDRRWADGDARVPRAQRPAAVPRRVRVPRAGARRTATTRRMFLQLRGRHRVRHDAARRAPPARQRPRRPRRHRRAPGGAARDRRPRSSR